MMRKHEREISKVLIKSLPSINLETKKIQGCKKGSWLWWHEKGHLEYRDSIVGSTLEVYQNMAFTFWMISTTLSVVNKFMLWLSIPLLVLYIAIDLYEEKWCNDYASRQFYKQ